MPARALPLLLRPAGLACTQLRELRLRSCQGVSDAAVLTVAIHCRDLRELDLSMCVHVTDYSLGAVGLYCRRLETLCVDSCVSIHAQSFVQLAEHLGQELLVRAAQLRGA